jgi:glucose/arabinose dehydrogenase/cytochrome c553
MQRIGSILISLIVVAIAIALGVAAADTTQQLIRLVLPLPDMPLHKIEIFDTFGYLLVAAFLTFALAAWMFAQALFASAERTAKQVYTWGAAWGAGSLYLFLMTSDVFPHHLLVGAFVIGVALFWAAYAVFGKDRDIAGRTGIGGRFVAAIAATFKLLLKPFTWLAVLVTVLPLIAAVLYVANQNFRDSVAEFRVQQNASVEGDWMTVPVNTKTQLLQPITLRMEAGRPGSMLVLERAGRLYRMGYPDNGTKELLFDISAVVGEVNLENGALGFDFDPRYGQAGEGAGFVYLYYTSYTPQKQVNYLSRFDLSLADPAARLASRFDLIAQERLPNQYHNAGHVELGPDGMLYVSVGEMGMEASLQRLDKTLSGGILRIDVTGTNGLPIPRQPEGGKTQGYTIPVDNPFVKEPGALAEFYAIGLRNPFRFHIDKPTGLAWTGDVGSTTWEEVNAVARGGNYQYPFDEGGRAGAVPKPAKVYGEEHGPVFTYQHTAYDRSVIGGIVYRGKRWPQLDGQYIFGDNYSGKFWAMPAQNRKVSAVQTLGQADKYAQRGFTSIIQTPDDRILITIMGSSSAPNGEIVELVLKSQGASASIAGAGAVVAAAAEAATMSQVAIRESYVTNCARCHGATGYGDGPDAALLKQQLKVMPTNFHTAQFKAKDRAEIRLAIAKGGGAVNMSVAMPPWEGLLEDKEIDALTDYVLAMPAE